MRFIVDLSTLYGGGIYVIRNSIDDRVYIGRTKSFRDRAIAHSDSMYNGKCNSKFRELLSLHPDVELTFEVLERCFDIVKREEYYIDKFKSVEYGFNILHNDEEFYSMPRKKIHRSAKPKKIVVSVEQSNEEILKNKIHKGSRYWHPADLGWIRKTRAYKVINGKKHDLLGNEI